MSVNITLQIYEKEMTGDAGQHLFWRRSTSFLAQVNFFSGAGQHLFWRRWDFWGGTCATPGHRTAIRGAGPHPFFSPAPKHPYTCAKNGPTCAKIPLHLRQKSATPAPSIDLTSHSHHVQARLVQRNGLQAQIPCTSLSGKGLIRPIDGNLEHKTAL